MSKKLLVIHGGDTYPSPEAYLESLKTREVYLDRMKSRVDWKATLEMQLDGAFEVFLPRMPIADNATYELWKLWFERVLSTIDEMPIFVGHSLGAMFLVKYYSEVILTAPVPGLFLVAPEHLSSKVLKDEQNSFTLKGNLGVLTENAEKVVFFHSEDDPVVSFDNQAIFKEMVPDAQYITLPNRGHFLGDTFPEMVAMLKNLA